MASRWKYGNYQFDINPSSQDVTTQLIGDNMRTLSGTLISQPSLLQDKYGVSTIFYQPRTRVKSKVSLQNAVGIDFYGDKIYVVNKVNDRIDIYNKNFVFQSSVSLSAVTTKTYIGITVTSTNIYIASTIGSTIKVHVLTLAGALSSSITSGTLSGVSYGFTYFSNYYWSISNNGGISKIRPTDGVVISTITMPFNLTYEGLTNDGEYIIVGNKDTASNVQIYHVDSANGKIINQISGDAISAVNDIAYDGDMIYGINGTSFLLQVIDGNTVECELYNFQKEIMTKSFVNMTDDMGVTKKVFISDLRTGRRQDFENAYDVSMTIIKVDRG